MKIQDGKGTGQLAEVRDNKLRCYSVIEQEQHYANEDLGRAYSIVLDETTDSTSAQFFYMKNNGSDLIIITSIKGFVSVDTQIKVIMEVSGNAINPSTLTDTNRNAGSGKNLNATILQGPNLQYDNGYTVDLFKMSSSYTGLFKITWGSTLILPKNTTICLESSEISRLNLTISCFEHIIG